MQFTTEKNCERLSSLYGFEKNFVDLNTEIECFALLATQEKILRSRGGLPQENEVVQEQQERQRGSRRPPPNDINRQLINQYDNQSGGQQNGGQQFGGVYEQPVYKIGRAHV